MTDDLFTPLLSGYLDGDLNDLERRRVEAHLESCVACRRVLADLHAIVAAAPHYQGREPGRDLWPGIAAGLGPASAPASAAPIRRIGSRSRWSFGSWPMLLAAGLLVAVLSGGSVWLATRSARPPTGDTAGLPPARFTNAATAEFQYEAAVSDLERILEEGRSRLDTATVRVVEENLRKIDAAIAEARAAIARDSANAYLSHQVAANMRRKLNLLRAVAGALART